MLDAKLDPDTNFTIAVHCNLQHFYSLLLTVIRDVIQRRPTIIYNHNLNISIDFSKRKTSSKDRTCSSFHFDSS